mgnify:CR=1 FL=1
MNHISVRPPTEIATYTWNSFIAGKENLCVLHVYASEDDDNSLGLPSVVSIPSLNSDISGRFFPVDNGKPAYFREPVASHSYSDGSRQNTYGVTLTIRVPPETNSASIEVATLTPKEAARVAEFESLVAYGATKDIQTRTKAITSLMKHAKRLEGVIIYDAHNHCGCSNSVYAEVGRPENLRAFF